VFISVDVGKKVVVETPEVVDGVTVVDDKFSVVVRRAIVKISDPKEKIASLPSPTQSRIFLY